MSYGLNTIVDDNGNTIAEWYKTDMQGHFIVDFMTTEPHLCIAVVWEILKQLGARV